MRPINQKFLIALVTFVLGCSGGKYLDEADLQVSQAEDQFLVPTLVTAGNESNYSPDLSPNGMFLVYTSDRNGNKDIWEKRTSGGFARQLTDHSADDYWPVLSPDGSRVAFVSRREDAAGDVHILDLGFSFGKLVGDIEGSVRNIELKLTEESNPEWYPDGQKVIFTARKPGDKTPSIMTAEIDDLKAQPLGDLKGDQPVVSPDGNQVAFVRDGALFLYDATQERTTRLTMGGDVQDGQPSFSPDGKFLVFIRYLDDTNKDGLLNGDDRPSLWRLNIEAQKKSKYLDNVLTLPLASASISAYSPQIRGPFLYFTRQSRNSLDVFRLPAAGQFSVVESAEVIPQLLVTKPDPLDKLFLIRRAQFLLFSKGDLDKGAEFMMDEMSLLVSLNKRIEARLLKDKVSANFPDNQFLNSYVEILHSRLLYHDFAFATGTRKPSAAEVKKITALNRKLEKTIELFSTDSIEHKRIRSLASLVRAELLAARSELFPAKQLVDEILIKYNNIKDIPDQSALLGARLSEQISGKEAAVAAYIDVVRKFEANTEVVAKASKEAVKLAETMGKDPIESLMNLRQRSLSLRDLPARAHNRIAEIYRTDDKEAVAANELRQIATTYKKSPVSSLNAAEEFSKIEEKNGRFSAAETVLGEMAETLKDSRIEYVRESRRLRTQFWLRRGENFVKLGNFAGAISEFEKIIAIDSLNISAHRGLISAKNDADQLKQTIETYEKHANANPNSAEYQYLYGYSLSFLVDKQDSPGSRLSAIDDAIDVVEGARFLDSQLLFIHQTLGWLYYQKGYWQKQYFSNGGFTGSLAQSWALTKSTFGGSQPNWIELAIDSFLSGYFLAEDDSLEKAWLSQNLAQSYYELKNFQKSLQFYLERIRLIEIVPVIDLRVEGVLWQHAGRAAFNINELELAEGLQRKSLGVWERANNDTETARSLDALALTLRELKKYKEALKAYEKLLFINSRMGNRENIANTKLNIGLCHFWLTDDPSAIEMFNEVLADADQIVNEDYVDPTVSDGILVDLGGEGSEANGFDMRRKRIIAITFLARSFERMNRIDLAANMLGRKIEYLNEYLENKKNVSKKSVLNELAASQNQLSVLELKLGSLVAARDGFKSARDTAKELRDKDQIHENPNEWVNTINQGKVQVRLAQMQIDSPESRSRTGSELKQSAANLLKSFDSGAAPDGPPAASLLQVKSQLALLTQDQAAASVDARKALDLGVKTNVDSTLKLSAMFTVTQSEAGKDLVQLKRKLRRASIENKEFEWKYLYANKRMLEAFDSAERYVSEGRVISNPADRRMIRDLVGQLLNEPGFSKESTLRRYWLLDLTNIVNRMNHTEEVRDKWIKPLLIQDTSDLQEALGDKGLFLGIERFETGRITVYMLTAEEEKTLTIESEELNSTKLKELFSNRTWETVYLNPGGRSFTNHWTETFKGISDRVVYLPGPDLLLAKTEQLRVKGSVLFYPQSVAKTQAADAEEVETDEKPENAKPAKALIPLYSTVRNFSFDVFVEDPSAPMNGLFGGRNIVHVERSLELNRSEPQNSIVYMGSRVDPGNLSGDFSLRDFDGRNPGTATLIFDRVSWMPGVESNEYSGWKALWLGATASGIRNSVLNFGEPLEAIEWAKFYKQLQTNPVSDALRGLKPNKLKVIGFPGPRVSDYEEYAEENLEDLLEEGADAFDEKDYRTAASIFQDMVYLATIAEDDDILDKGLELLSKSLYAGDDFLGALHYQKKLAQRFEERFKNKTINQIQYGDQVLDAAILAVRGKSFEEADKLLTDSETIFTEAESNEFLGKTWAYRAINFANQNEYEKAVEAYNKSYEFYFEDDEVMGAARLLDIGNTYASNLNDYGKAIEYYTKAAEIFSDNDEDISYLKTLIDKANSYLNIGQLQKAIVILQRDVIEEIDVDEEKILWIRATQILANAYFRAGQFQPAQDLNEQTIDEINTITSKAAKATWAIDALSLRALIRAKLGNYEDSVSDFIGALRLAEEFDLKSKTTLIYNNYGFVAREFGKVDLSIKLFEEALRLDTILKSPSSIAFDERNLGLSLILKGDLNRARQLLESSRKTSEELGLSYNLAYCWFGLGDLNLREQKYAEAFKNFETALAVSTKGNMMDFVWRAYAGMGLAMFKEKNLKEAEPLFEKAVDVMEFLRAGLKSETSKNAFQSDQGVQDLYGTYLQLAMRLDKPGKAWQLAERSRGRAFIDSIGNQGVDLGRPKTATLLQKESENRAEIELLERALNVTSDKKKITDYSERLEKLMGERTEILSQIATTDRELVLFLDVESPDVKPTNLPSDTGVLAYFVGKDALYSWFIDANGVSGRTIGMNEHVVESYVRDLRVLMQNFSTTDFLLRELSSALIDPFKDKIMSVKRLAVVPHRAFRYLPFSALRIDDRDLIDVVGVFYLDSFGDLQKSDPVQERKIMALVNPVSEGKGSLPFAEKEGEVLSRYFAKVDLRTGTRATESEFRNKGNEYNTIHIASHATFDRLYPVKSSLHLASDDKNDGKLTVEELFKSSLPLDLITLSGCETGLGVIGSNDEVTGLNRALYFAGARSVVSTLWRINDVTSAVLMKRFYRYLSEGHDKAEAMRLSQQVVRKHFSHPAYWAAYRLFGAYQ